ncbi:hypothetical protein [Hyalangium sp.]|uniref:hypothetical protein n=1 Tax=Hyalangium sp. TaxID=2028555 RepID=UPI002D4C4794|nr:hypothetical protein [Hyalangium sp.]HYH98129.1 hypothetical protein [Hyalangium sp.]
MKTFAMMAIGISAATLAACSTDVLPRERGADDELSTGVSESELLTLLTPEPGAAAAEYEASTSRYRLFGVQISQVPGESFATLAETSTWATRNLRVGELLGRNLRVTAITSEGLELTGGVSARVLPVGQDVLLRIIRHRFDQAAVHRGRHHWKVDGGAVAQLRSRYGLGVQTEQVTLFLEPAIRLIHLQAEGVFSRLGFREGDLLFSMNGKSLTPDELGAVADRMAEQGSTVRLRVFREGGLHEFTFSVEAP